MIRTGATARRIVEKDYPDLTLSVNAARTSLGRSATLTLAGELRPENALTYPPLLRHLAILDAKCVLMHVFKHFYDTIGLHFDNS